jgi:hypothetical protein
MACYAIIILAGILAAQPNLLTAQQLASMHGWVPKQQVTLGLDYQLVTSSGIVGKVIKGIVPKGGAPAANN